jgi:hypothetical protein
MWFPWLQPLEVSSATSSSTQRAVEVDTVYSRRTDATAMPGAERVSGFVDQRLNEITRVVRKNGIPIRERILPRSVIHDWINVEHPKAVLVLAEMVE